MNLSQFLKENIAPMVFEAISKGQYTKAITLCRAYLGKKNVFVWGFPLDFSANGGEYDVFPFYSKSGVSGGIAWRKDGDANYIESIFVTDETSAITGAPIIDAFMLDKKTNMIEIALKGANTIQALKLIEAVCGGKVKCDIKSLKDFIRGAQLFEASAEDAEYGYVYEDVINEDDADDIKKKRSALYYKIRSWKKKGKDVSGLEAEYAELTDAYNNARASVSTVSATPVTTPTISKWEAYLAEQEKATPEERFDDMNSYVTSVIIGRRPLALLCGAPGVGKTFRVMKNVKTAGLKMDQDYKLLKGKCTATALFTALHDFKEKGQVVVFDDCDSIFKDEDAVNLLKAAYDSSDERWVSWNTSQKIVMDPELAEDCDDAVYNEAKQRWEYPKQFLYKGGGVIITNWRAGQIDTAIRNRALICDLDFTVQEILELVENTVPYLDCDEASSRKALSFLHKLADLEAPLEISIRSFLVCAGEYSTGASDKTCERRIIEQMKNLAARGGKKY